MFFLLLYPFLNYGELSQYLFLIRDNHRQEVYSNGKQLIHNVFACWRYPASFFRLRDICFYFGQIEFSRTGQCASRQTKCVADCEQVADRRGFPRQPLADCFLRDADFLRKIALRREKFSKFFYFFSGRHIFILLKFIVL